MIGVTAGNCHAVRGCAEGAWRATARGPIAAIANAAWCAAGALALGAVCYKISVVLDAHALRLIGAAREAAYFATAPFVGAVASVLLLGDALRWPGLLPTTAMACGVALLLRERHAHVHGHDELHHVHDDHHRHEHRTGDPVGESNGHAHTHAALVHDHPHLPVAHHRHRH